LACVGNLTGTIVEVIGTDGIKSQVRKNLFGKDDPASDPQYTHKCAYRALVPMGEAEKALGVYKARNQHMHVGPLAHLMHYPVANGALINVTCFITDPKEWPKDLHTTQRGSRKDVEEAFSKWCAPVRNIIKQFPEELEKWAVFDMWEYPAPFYNKGKVCLAGDAAHASSPHHGAGACSGVEDVLCLVSLIEECLAHQSDVGTSIPKGRAIELAFQTYDSIRRSRSQWLVNSSRRVCDLYHQPEWAEPKKWVKAKTCFEEIKDRSHKIWHFDHADMVVRAISDYRKRAGYE
jgi:salicylate hydroxylase